jgi:hypothetical protein
MDIPACEFVLELLRERNTVLESMKQNYAQGLITFDEYRRCSFAVIEEIGELRALLRDALSGRADE